MGNDLFRKSALEKLSSPEQLDKTIRILPMKGWIALIGMILLVGALVVWLFLGTVPSEVQGAGIFMYSEGIRKVESSSTALVSDVFFEEGDTVKRGQVVARLEIPELLSEMNKARNEQDNLRKKYEEQKVIGQETLAMKLGNLQQKQQNMESYKEKLQERLKNVTQSLETENKLYEDGLIMFNQLSATRNEQQTVLQEINQAQQSIDDMDISRKELREDERFKEQEMEIQLADLDRNREMLEANYKRKSEVVSPTGGRVLEVLASKDTYIGQGQAVLSLEENGNEASYLTAVMYFNAKEGKKIKEGMRIAISPSVAKKEEYGTMFGIVTSVSAYPATQQRIVQVLGDQGLATLVAKNEVSIEVRASLIPDAETPSGYLWSSSKGPDMTIGSGFLCSGAATTEQRHPISLVIPMLKKTFLGIGE